MPNFTGQYNFAELCQKAGASAPWIKKVQRLFKLGEGEGTKGVRTYYSEEQVHIYSAIKKLRLMDIEFDEIKGIFEVEKKLRKFAINPVPFDSLTNHDRLIYICLTLLLPPSHVLLLDGQLLRKNHQEFEKLFGEYNKIQIYLMTRAKAVKETADQLYTYVEKNSKENEKKIFMHLYGPQNV